MSKNVFGTKLGRVHMTKQDLGKLQTRKMKGLKKSTQENADTSGPGSEAAGGEAMDTDQ